MEVHLEIDAGQKTIITYRASEDGQATQELFEDLKDLVDRQKIRIEQDGSYHYLPVQKIKRIYTENKLVYCETATERYRLKERLYQLRAILPEHRFLQISNSEIINRAYLKQFDLSKTGMYQVIFTDGQMTYASRRYMQAIKRSFKL
ncbi:LytTR family DNA-binding domain-containing protein [Convivina intestini]|uniref:LytTR family transcriptional regulator n=1 Tax=Convivina intestini TaxID=1505726 RepID=A0A2U1D672_9LACO|nr:LytTR family DNA-binding domain-containing protein [Convivina intestini]PVY83183.1 LytTR family transcriptional regulator [Convivina intestini]CAH1856146.1 putative HTH-type transcriptional regulator [Convivina intestini]SDB96158.1 transcriptional regulator, LytTR family [Leuconostocaceae bacterium R-53105]